MPVFKCFWKIIKKNAFGFLIYFAIFMGMTLIFTNFGGGSSPEVFEANSLDIAVVDRDHSEISAALTEYLAELHQLIELEDEVEVMQDALFFQEVQYILIIPAGFEESFISGRFDIQLENVKAPGSFSGTLVDNQIQSYFNTLRMYLEGGFELEAGLARTVEDLTAQVTVEVHRDHEEVETVASAFFFQFLPYIFIIMLLSALGPIFIAFNRMDLARRMECSSLKLKERNTQLILGCVASSLGIWIVFMVVAHVLYFEEMMNTIGHLRVLNSFVFLLVAGAIAFLVGQVVKNSEALMGASNVIGLSLSFLSGIFVPLEILGDNVVAVARFTPTYWYIRSNNMLRDATTLNVDHFQTFFEGVGMQLAFALALFAIALVIIRQRKYKPAI